MPLPSENLSSLAWFKPRLVLPFWYRYRLSRKKTLNGCSSSCGAGGGGYGGGSNSSSSSSSSIVTLGLAGKVIELGRFSQQNRIL